MNRIRSVPDPSVEKQQHDAACGAACTVMLAKDRGVVLDQKPIADRILSLDLQSEALRQLGGLDAKEMVKILNQKTGGRAAGFP